MYEKYSPSEGATQVASWILPNTNKRIRIGEQILEDVKKNLQSLEESFIMGINKLNSN